MSYRENNRQTFEGLSKPSEAEKLLVGAELASHHANVEQKNGLPHTVANFRNEAVNLYKQLGDHYVSIGSNNKAEKIYALMRKEKKMLDQFLRTSQGDTHNVPSGN